MNLFEPGDEVICDTNRYVAYVILGPDGLPNRLRVRPTRFITHLERNTAETYLNFNSMEFSVEISHLKHCNKFVECLRKALVENNIADSEKQE